MVVDGVVISETDADTVRKAYSFTKSLVAVGVAFAMQDGIFFLDAETDRQLQHTDGWENARFTSGSRIHPIGSWAYSSLGVQKVAEKIEAVAGMGFDAYLDSKLTRLGMTITWDHADQNYGGSAEMSVRDAAKFLLMLMRGGEWNEFQVLQSRYVIWLLSGRNTQVPVADHNNYRDGNLQEPSMFSRNLFWFGNNSFTDSIIGHGFGGQGAASNNGFCGWAFPLIDTVIVTGGPDARRGVDANHLLNQPFAQIAAARNGIGLP